MTALANELLAEVRAAGGRIALVAPGRLKVRAPAPLPDELIVRLRAAKPELLAALRPPSKPSSSVTRAEWDAADWRCFYDERAAIREYDGKRPRREAERLAWGELQNEWHRLHGERTPAWQCAGCQNALSGSPVFAFPDGARAHDNLACIAAYGRRWRSAATAALVALGLPKPASVPEDAP